VGSWQRSKGKVLEDTLFGTFPLVVQLLDIYVECNGVNMKILDAWDGEQLKLAF
jgi:hypothetical protein